MTTIADLSVKIGADLSGLQTGLNQADNSLRGFAKSAGDKFNALKSGMDSFVSGMAPLSAILGVGLGASIKVASDFEGVMAEIGARAQLTGDDMARVSDFALQMGADTAFSGQQAGEALLQLLSGGQNVEQAMATLPAVLDAAAASGVDLGTTADGVTDILSIFGLQATDAASVVDSLAKASGASKAEIGDMIEAMRNGGSAAAAFGMDQNRTNAVLTAFAARGKTGAEAGTLLKSMLENMSRNTDSVRAAWAALGTSMYDTEGNVRDFAVVIEEVKDGLEGMTVEEQNSTLQDLAGTFGIAGIRALVTGQSITDLETAMANSAGATEVADARMDTFGGRMDSLKGSVETLMITALTPLMDDVLKPLAEKLTPVINSMTEWAEKNPTIAGGVLLVAGGIAIATPLVWGLSMAMGAVSTAFTAVSGIIGAVTLPMVLLAGALMLADWGQIGTGLGQAGDGLVKFLQGDPAAYGLIGDGLRNIGEGFAQIPLTAADAMLELAGIDLGSAEDNFAGFGVALENVGTLMSWVGSDVVYHIENMVADSAWHLLSFYAAIQTLLGDTAGAAATDATRYEIAARNDGRDVADAFTSSMNQGMLDGVSGIALDPATMFKITQDPEAAAAGLTERAKDILQLAIQNAIGSGDMQFLLQVAPLMGTTELQNDSDFFTKAVAPAREALISAMSAASTEAGSDPSWMLALQGAIETTGVPAGFANWDTTVLSNEVQAALLTAMSNNGGTLEVGIPISYSVDVTTGDVSPITVEDFLASLNMKQLAEDSTPALRMTVEDMLATAIAENDPGVITMLRPLAIALGIDVPDVQNQLKTKMQAALETVQGYVALGAQLSTVNGQSAMVWYINPDSPNAKPVDGKHKDGLPYVPRDGYVGELHRGEAVLTANQADAWRDGRGGGMSVEHHYHVASYGTSPHELLALLQQAQQDGSR